MEKSQRLTESQQQLLAKTTGSCDSSLTNQWRGRHDQQDPSSTSRLQTVMWHHKDVEVWTKLTKSFSVFCAGDEHTLVFNFYDQRSAVTSRGAAALKPHVHTLFSVGGAWLRARGHAHLHLPPAPIGRYQLIKAVLYGLFDSKWS